MTCLQNDILIDKLQFSFSQNQTTLYNHMNNCYGNILINHTKSFRKHYANHVLEFNPSFNLNTMHNLENITEAEIKNIVAKLFKIKMGVSKQVLKQMLTSMPYSSIKLTRLHLTRDFLCTNPYVEYYRAVKMITPKSLRLKLYTSKESKSLYYRYQRKGFEPSNSLSLLFYDKCSELLNKGHINNLSSVPFVRGANALPASTVCCYNLSQQDIMRIEVAMNRSTSQHMISFEHFVRLLHSGYLYRFLARRYKQILCKYLFYEHLVHNVSDSKKLLKEVVLEQGIDLDLYRTLFALEGVSKSRTKALTSFLGSVGNQYAVELVNSL